MSSCTFCATGSLAELSGTSVNFSERESLVDRRERGAVSEPLSFSSGPNRLDSWTVLSGPFLDWLLRFLARLFIVFMSVLDFWTGRLAMGLLLESFR